MADRYISAQDIVNRVSVEVISQTSSDVFADTNPTYIQLRSLLTTCGQEFVEAYEWEYLRREHQITTTSLDSGEYPLPEDFAYMIDQTGWERSNRNPLSGPLSAQQWAYLEGRNLVDSSIYVTVRVMQNMFNVYPNNPVPDALDIHFEYISRNWIQDGSGFNDRVQNNGDIILFNPVLMVQYLKYRFLSAKGFDTTEARQAFTDTYNRVTGRNQGSPIINAGLPSSRTPFLSYKNIPDSGFGL